MLILEWYRCYTNCQIYILLWYEFIIFSNGKSISSEETKTKKRIWILILYYVKNSFWFLITLIFKSINKIVSKKKDH
jgi:hypothetical protein